MVALAVLGERLNLVISEGFSNLKEFMFSTAVHGCGGWGQRPDGSSSYPLQSHKSAGKAGLEGTPCGNVAAVLEGTHMKWLQLRLCW